MGSPLYMSPEQMTASRNVDTRTDLWAIGVILYELLAGRVPFDGETLPEVCVKIATQAPPVSSRHLDPTSRRPWRRSSSSASRRIATVAM